MFGRKDALVGRKRGYQREREVVSSWDARNAVLRAALKPEAASGRPRLSAVRTYSHKRELRT